MNIVLYIYIINFDKRGLNVGFIVVLVLFLLFEINHYFKIDIYIENKFISCYFRMKRILETKTKHGIFFFFYCY